MEYLVFVIYIIVIVQFINSKPVSKNGTQRGCEFYKTSGIANILVGNLGMIAVNSFLRDKNIIPQAFVWIALVGFALATIYGLYCIYKMLTTTEP